MGRVPVLKPQEVVTLLRSHGFEEIRQRGSHKQFRHPDGRVTTVPFHKGPDISPVLLRKPAFLTKDRREPVQTRVDPGWPASPSPQAGLRPVEDSDEDTARRCGRLRGRSRGVVRNAGEIASDVGMTIDDFLAKR